MNLSRMESFQAAASCGSSSDAPQLVHGSIPDPWPVAYGPARIMTPFSEVITRTGLSRPAKILNGENFRISPAFAFPECPNCRARARTPAPQMWDGRPRPSDFRVKCALATFQQDGFPNRNIQLSRCGGSRDRDFQIPCAPGNQERFVGICIRFLIVSV